MKNKGRKHINHYDSGRMANCKGGLTHITRPIRSMSSGNVGKSGKKELEDIINSDDFKAMEHIKIRGLMGIATFTGDKAQIREEFKSLKQLFDTLKLTIPTIDTLSMGMSGDYKIAIEEGSTMVRIGSSIFGARNYT